nr:thioesterase family protein [Spelaeicoccus albus]
MDSTTYRPTTLTGGAWTPTEQHISPMGGLIAHAVEKFVAARGDDGRQISRLSIDILGVLTLDDFDVSVDVVRPGKTVELLEVTVTSNGRAAVRARVWRLASADTSSVAGGEPDRLPAPETIEPWPLTSVWPGEYIQSLELRAVRDPEPGRATAWIASRAKLVDNERVSPLAEYLALIDTTNGIAVRQSPDEWLFPNLDLTIHLHRTPSGPWVGLDTSVVFGPEGVGLTSTVLHDVDGPVGRAEQSLTLRPRT